MPWHVQYRETAAGSVVWLQEPEAAIEAACRLMDDGIEVSGIGDDQMTDSTGKLQIARIYALRVAAAPVTRR